MSPYLSFFIIYSVSWWLVLLMVLPFGVEIDETPDKATYAAAPRQPRIRRKLLLTTGIALVPAGLLQWALASGVLRGLL